MESLTAYKADTGLVFEFPERFESKHVPFRLVQRSVVVFPLVLYATRPGIRRAIDEVVETIVLQLYTVIEVEGESYSIALEIQFIQRILDRRLVSSIRVIKKLKSKQYRYIDRSSSVTNRDISDRGNILFKQLDYIIELELFTRMIYN